MRKRVLMAALVLTLACAAALWPISKSRTFQFFGQIVARVETTEPVVALTFDDGPEPGATDQILEILQETDTKATFFLIGQSIADNPEAARKVAEAGHEIGNHTFTHDRWFLVSSLQNVASELERTDHLIRSAGYGGTIHVRPPFGKKLFTLPYHLARTGRKTIMWDIEPESYPEVAKSAAAITEHVLQRVRPGSIILLHVMYPSSQESVNAVRPIIEGLKARGYRFATVSELLARQN